MPASHLPRRARAEWAMGSQLDGQRPPRKPSAACANGQRAPRGGAGLEFSDLPPGPRLCQRRATVSYRPCVALGHPDPKKSLVRGTDPVQTGLVASLKRPGGNVTGINSLNVELSAKRIGLLHELLPGLAGKRLEILREVLPGLRTLAILAHVASPNAVLEMREVQAAARTLGLDAVASEVRRAQDIAPALDALKGRADALYVCPSPLLTTNRIRINTLALAVRLPTMHGFREFTEAGGLMSYGPNFPSLFRRAAEYVDKILRGAKPADLPVEQPTQFDLVLNLTTAKALGLDIPTTLLARADEVIEWRREFITLVTAAPAAARGRARCAAPPPPPAAPRPHARLLRPASMRPSRSSRRSSRRSPTRDAAPRTQHQTSC